MRLTFAWGAVLIMLQLVARDLLDRRTDLIEDRTALANRSNAGLGGPHPGCRHSSPI